jgi:hypothetical protein
MSAFSGRDEYDGTAGSVQENLRLSPADPELQ